MLKEYTIKIRKVVTREYEYKIMAERTLEAQKRAKELAQNANMFSGRDLQPDSQTKTELVSLTVDGKTRNYED